MKNFIDLTNIISELRKWNSDVVFHMEDFADKNNPFHVRYTYSLPNNTNFISVTIRCEVTPSHIDLSCNLLLSTGVHVAEFPSLRIHTEYVHENLHDIIDKWVVNLCEFLVGNASRIVHYLTGLDTTSKPP